MDKIFLTTQLREPESQTFNINDIWKNGGTRQDIIDCINDNCLNSIDLNDENVILDICNPGIPLLLNYYEQKYKKNKHTIAPCMYIEFYLSNQIQ